MKHIATVPAALMRAAMLYQAKQDVRYYLNGVYIDADCIVATDGHTMLIAPYQSDLRPEKPMIIAIDGKIPKDAVNLHLLFDNECKIGVVRCVGPAQAASLPGGGMAETDLPPMSIFNKQGHPTVLPYHFIDGRFPDYQRVIPKGEPVPTTCIGVNMDLMAKAAKAMAELGYKSHAMAVTLYGPESSMVLSISATAPEPKFKIIVMPCRM